MINPLTRTLSFSSDISCSHFLYRGFTKTTTNKQTFIYLLRPHLFPKLSIFSTLLSFPRVLCPLLSLQPLVSSQTLLIFQLLPKGSK